MSRWDQWKMDELHNWCPSNPVIPTQKTEDAKILQGSELFSRGRKDMQVVTERLCRLTHICMAGFTIPQIPALLAYSPANSLHYYSKRSTILKSFEINMMGLQASSIMQN